MTDREKIIKGLECCRIQQNEVPPMCEECPYADNALGTCEDMSGLLNDAYKMLKAQEPRVMTLEEVEAMPYGHVLIETDKSEALRWLDALLFCKNANFSFDFITLEGRARLLGTEYNREWRCWTARPTDEQREAAPWQD